MASGLLLGNFAALQKVQGPQHSKFFGPSMDWAAALLLIVWRK